MTRRRRRTRTWAAVRAKRQRPARQRPALPGRTARRPLRSRRAPMGRARPSRRTSPWPPARAVQGPRPRSRWRISAPSWNRRSASLLCSTRSPTMTRPSRLPPRPPLPRTQRPSLTQPHLQPPGRPPPHGCAPLDRCSPRPRTWRYVCCPPGAPGTTWGSPVWPSRTRRAARCPFVRTKWWCAPPAASCRGTAAQPRAWWTAPT
mmetsp:Transcript_17194/g.53193  ORF Transcript_17194/g.53193 Transcript_17194/m.53193 type:complete len:204 (+) Transcript_17194:1396-2007(+)